MLEALLSLLFGLCVLAFGICLSAAFAGIQFNRTNLTNFAIFCGFCSLLQLILIHFLGEDLVWKLYPLITHLPLILLLHLAYHKQLATAMTAVFTAYLLCQPSKWLGVLVLHLSGSPLFESLVRCLSLALVAYVALACLSGCLSDIFNKDRRSVLIFGIIPATYYVFDYITGIYTDLWISSNRVVVEFMPLFLAITFMVFCSVYYKEYEQKTEAQRKEQIIRLTVEQQSKKIQAVKHSEQEIRLIRHDMRLLLSSLAVSIENGEHEKAQQMIASYTSHIDGTRLEHFCNIDTVNYVLSDYASKCEAEKIPFLFDVTLDSIHVDEVSFCSILSNGLDNAFNAQMMLPPAQRKIKLMLKYSDGRLLISIKNPCARKIIFSDGLPVSDKKGHGYGTQSIRFLTERLGGNCQFSLQNDVFILRIIL